MLPLVSVCERYRHYKVLLDNGIIEMHTTYYLKKIFLPRFFLALKYHFLNGYANRRMDDLLLLLSERVQAYYRYILV